MHDPISGRRARADVWLFVAALALSGCVAGGGGGSDDPDQGGGFGGFGGGVGSQDSGGLILDAAPADAGDMVADAMVEVDACVPAGDEVCNGADDDCDGTTDEGFEGVGEPCTAGQGACAAEGTLGCTEDGAGTVCDAVPGEPGVESCNEQDDDCDGDVDENFRVGISCQFSEGECLSRGVEVCTADGTDTECDAEPIVIQEELCDGFDNDCDGLADEGIELGAICEAGEGLCRRGGFVECQDDGSVICTAQPGEPREEACNGFDDDCDGIADEDFGAEACEAGVGACRREGQTVCQEDGSLECNVVPGEPAMELCNGIDDDCDGEADEDFGGQAGGPCQNGDGVCARFGEFECAPGGFEVICNADPAGPAAGAEVCNGEDDDCDGTVDEEIEGVGVVCDEVEIGACQAAVTACNDAGEVVCQAIDLEPGEEFCNGIDDDCDGTVDEDYPQLGQACDVGQGQCVRQGVFACEAGAGGGLGGGANFEGIQQDLPEAQILAGGFEECWRGRYNEGQPPVAQILEQCGDDILMLGCRPAGNPALTLAAMGEREAILRDSAQEQNPVNVHNGVNWYFSDRHSWGFGPVGEPLSRNSCDTGNTRPELRMCWHTSNGNVSSGYRCGATFLNGNAQWERIIYHRPSGPGMVCSEQAGEPAEEACNGADDDCDGATDEGAAGTGLVCQEGVGLCERGETVCNPDGEIICRAIPIEPAEELCNGIDDDCDGVVDNVPGVGEACDAGLGVCARPGVQACAAPNEGVQLMEGVLQDLDPAELERMGMRRCFAQGMSERGQPIAGILEECQGEVMLIGCRDVGQPNLRVAAMGLRAEMLTDTGRVAQGDGALHQHNGVGWYFNDSYSWGFVPGGQAVNRNSCDVEQREAEDRMCWHTSGQAMSSGYRCGSSTNSGALERVIWVADRLGGLICEGEAADAASPEVCNGLDDDCDGDTDEGFGLNEPCEAGVGACRAEGVTVCDENGEPVCGAEVPEPGVEECNGLDDDCDGSADEGLNCPFFASCRAAMEAGNVESGSYPIITDNGVQRFWCDMETDGGGWTLVGSTTGQTMDDFGVPYYADLATLAPAQANPAIYNGFDFGNAADVRFACRQNGGAADAAMTVDLSFYAVPWYSEWAAAANDGASCFSEGNGAGDLDPPPARRNNVAGLQLARGDQWNSGYLEGEDGCASNDDFTVDFDDRGMDSNQNDGTDWGEDDGSRKCGQGAGANAQWFIFVRENAGFIDVQGSVTVIGPEAVAQRFRQGLVNTQHLAYADVPADAAGVEITGDAVFWLTPTDPADWPKVQALLPLIDAHSRAGGHVVADRGLIGAFGTTFADGFAFADQLGAPGGWFNAVAAAGGPRGDAPTELTPRGDGEQALPTVQWPYLSSGTAAFTRLEAEPGLPYSLQSLAAFPGDGSPAFPDRSHAALQRGLRCGGNVMLAGFDLAAGLADENPAATRALLRDLLVAAFTDAPEGLNDVCPPRGEFRPNVLVCGEVGFDVRALNQEGSPLTVAPGCAPNADTQALLLGADAVIDVPAVADYVAAGGIVITSRGQSAPVFNAVFEAEAANGRERGACSQQLRVGLQLTPADLFWRRVPFEAGDTCGFDLVGWPGITPLGGWAENTVQLAYRDTVGDVPGRVWLVETDWPDAAALDLLSARALFAMITAETSSGLHFEGIRQDVAQAELEAGGFELCYSGLYNQANVPVAPILAECDGDVLLMACRQVGQPNFLIAAMGERAEVLTDLAQVRDAVHNHNGVDWYYSDNYSWGFVGEGTGVSRNSCDTAAVQPELRMCWHTRGGNLNSGYRCGVTTNTNNGWERVLMHRPGPLQ